MHRIRMLLSLLFLRDVTTLFAVLGLVCSRALPASAQFVSHVTAQATSEQTPGYIDADNVVSAEGLYESPAGSGRFYVDTTVRGWNSNYGEPNDETPLIQFDLQKVMTVAKFRVWNINAPGYTARGFKDVTVQYSDDGKRWRTVAQRFRFGEGPGKDRYSGEEHVFLTPVTARYIRFCCDSTWRGPYGQPGVAGLSKVRFVTGEKSAPLPSPTLTHPNDSGLINVTLPPYNAKGDGVTDDSAAIQQAITDWQATRCPVYLPDGVYVVGGSLRYKLDYLYGDNHFRGQSREGTILRLRDNTFTDAAHPHPVLDIGRRGNAQGQGISADWFANYVSDLTIETGRGNPGAIGLRYYSNNTGALRNVTIRSGDGQGVIGLDLGTDMNGPHFVQHVSVEGFDTGILTAASVNSSVMEHITLKGQRVIAYHNNGQCVSIRGLRSLNAVPAVQSDYGFVTLIDAQLEGLGAALTQTAITNGEYLFARNVTTYGYLHAIQNNYGGGPNVIGPQVTEYVSSGKVLANFPTPLQSLNLPVEETPSVPQDDPNTWANVRNYRQISVAQDDTEAIQAAIDSGATTVYFPPMGSYVVRRDIYLRGKVRRVVAGQASLRFLNGATFQVVEGESPVVFVEGYNGPIENRSARTLVFKDGSGIVTNSGPGDLFLENVVGDFYLNGNRTWGRQVNAERFGTKIFNNGGDLWILGLKTERGGTLVDTSHGGRSEVLGGLCYTTENGDFAPMFVITDSSLSASIGEVAYSQQPFTVLVRERRNNVTRTLRRGESPLRFSFMVGTALPLYVGYRPAEITTSPLRWTWSHHEGQHQSAASRK